MSQRRREDIDRIADLEEEVAALRAQLRAMQDAIAADAIALRLPVHLPPARRRMLGLLLRGGVKAYDAIWCVLHPILRHDGGPDAVTVIRVHICLLRKELQPLGAEIVNIARIGYEMPPESIAILKSYAQPREVAA